METKIKDTKAPAEHPDWQEFYTYLDELRESGETNMLGARLYLADEFDMDKAFSSQVLSAWMKDFGNARKD